MNDVYERYLTGKSVAVVCPSDAMNSSKLGELIESFDIVVRLNNGYKIKEEHYIDMGKRCDILYTRLSPPLKNIDYSFLQNTKYISLAKPSGSSSDIYILDTKPDFIEVHCIDKELMDNSTKMLNCLATMGVMAVFELLTYDIKHLMIFGMTFHTTGYFVPKHEYAPKVKQKKEKLLKILRVNVIKQKN